MDDTNQQRADTWLWRAIIIVWVCCGLYGAYTLATSDREMIRFWDEADLVMDIAVPEFVTEGGRIGAISYATRKIGYAYPVKLCQDWFGDAGFEYYNILWFAILLAIPIPGMKRYWVAWFLKISAILALPFTIKYVTMLNPTLQSMALWLLLATLMVWWKQCRQQRSAGYWWFSMLVGVVGGLLVLTDFKWLPFVAVGVVLTLIWYSLEDRPKGAMNAAWMRESIRSVVTNAFAILIWVPIVMATVTIAHPPYGDMVSAMLFRMPDRLGVVRWGVCDNILMHLWYLGGFGFVVGTSIITLVQRRAGLRLHSQFAPSWIFALLIIGVFTFALWPRGARMYASAVVLLIQFGAIVAVTVLSRMTQRPDRILTWIGTGIMTVSLLVSVPKVRAALDTPTGLDSLKQNVLAHVPHWSDDGASAADYTYDPPLLAGYFAPVMIVRASGDRDVSWFSPKDGLLPEANWAVTNPALDHVTVIEQASSREAEPGWEMDPFFVLESMHRMGQVMDSFPAPFYTTPYYLCETTLESGRLRETILAHQRSIWQVMYIGTIHRRPFPGIEKAADSVETGP
ncbi:MAG: hypothetical protein GF341_06235 [candidate division Zixibacteria bacterium]|nr:hypothetical protein [candidate division Zixibacteria bacterium]